MKIISVIFLKQTRQEVTQNCNENRKDSFNANTCAVPNIFTLFPDDLVKEEERLKY